MSAIVLQTELADIQEVYLIEGGLGQVQRLLTDRSAVQQQGVKPLQSNGFRVIDSKDLFHRLPAPIPGPDWMARLGFGATSAPGVSPMQAQGRSPLWPSAAQGRGGYPTLASPQTLGLPMD